MISIKNYTSSVPAERSITNIEKLLVQFGATDIMKQYDGSGVVTKLCFRIIHNGQTLSFLLPVKPKPMEKIFYDRQLEEYNKYSDKYKRSNPFKITDKMRLDVEQQAIRTAWKNMHEWVHIQLTMLQLEQADFAEIFLPYMLVGNDHTVYSMMKESGFKALNG